MGIIIAPAELMILERVIEIREYAYTKKNNEIMEKNPNTAEKAIVVPLMFTVNLFATSRQMHAITAFIRLDWKR